MELTRVAIATLLAVNALPHLTKGLTGQPHQTPRRYGDTPIANAIWGATNAIAAIALWPAGHLHGPRWPTLTVLAITSLTAAIGLAAMWQRHPERNQP